MGDAVSFRGTIGRYRVDSESWWPEPPRPPAGAPNVVLVVLDDVGFAQLGCFGSDIATPNLDRLAARGLRYSNFHTTALCSPTRACVLTGRNHHSVGMGRITDLATGFPGYDSRIPPSCALLPEMLVPHGYAAYGVGKWHLTPDEDTHLGAPRGNWPLGRGFERYYGFFHGETNQFEPSLVHDNHRIAPPESWEDGYHVTEDLAEHAIEYINDLRHVDPDKPFLLYFATGACHSPHQAPAEWIAEYSGAFDNGWDEWREAALARQQADGLLPDDAELSSRPDWVPAWSDLSEDQRRLSARYMECFAGFLSHTDAQIGRVLDHIDALGETDDTVVVVLSDNGASSEGGPTGSINDVRPWNMAERTEEEALEKIGDIGGPWIHNNYPWGWTVAGNTPFRRWKREVHEGGTCDPLIVSYPRAITDSGVRRQYVHAIDVLPTLLDLIGVDAPDSVKGVAQREIEGTSFRSTLVDEAAPEIRDTQYFEMFGCRAIYHEGWKAVTYVSMMDGDVADDDDPWELYHVATDISELRDLASSEPDRLEKLRDLWWREAERYQVLPIDSMPFFEALGRPPVSPARDVYVYRTPMGPIEEVAAVNVRNRSHSIVAHVEVPTDDTGGVIISQGSGYGGFVMFMHGGRVTFAHNFVALEETRVTSGPITPGPHVFTMNCDVADQQQGTISLLVDDVEGLHEFDVVTHFRVCSRTATAIEVATERGPTDGGIDCVAPAEFEVALGVPRGQAEFRGRLGDELLDHRAIEAHLHGALVDRAASRGQPSARLWIEHAHADFFENRECSFVYRVNLIDRKQFDRPIAEPKLRPRTLGQLCRHPGPAGSSLASVSPGHG